MFPSFATAREEWPKFGAECVLGTDGEEICGRITAVASDGVFCAIPARRSPIAGLRGVTVAHSELVGRAPFNFSWRIMSYH